MVAAEYRAALGVNAPTLPDMMVAVIAVTDVGAAVTSPSKNAEATRVVVVLPMDSSSSSRFLPVEAGFHSVKVGAVADETGRTTPAGAVEPWNSAPRRAALYMSPCNRAASCSPCLPIETVGVP